MKQSNDVEQQKSLLPLALCRKAFVLRDYSQGLAVKFFAKMPVELQGRLDERFFEQFVHQLNRFYADAERPGLESVCETLAGCLTCYLAHLCMRLQYDKHLTRVAKYLKEQNDKVFLPLGLYVTDPIERGLRIVEISFLNEPATAPAVVVQRPPSAGGPAPAVA